MPISFDLAARKPAIVEEAMQQVRDGMGLREIAKYHGVDTKTINKWLLALGDEYLEVRQAFIDSMLAEASEEMELAGDTFPLSRARELWKKATWYAERRDRARYGQDKQVTVNIGIGVQMDQALADEAGELLEHIKG